MEDEENTTTSTRTSPAVRGTDLKQDDCSNSSIYAASSYSHLNTPSAISAEDSKGRVPMMKEGTHLLVNSSSSLSHPSRPPPPADASISTSAGITSTSTSAGVTFPGYPPSPSLVTRSSNTNSSTSQQRTKPCSPNEQEGAGQDYAAAKKRRRITLSTIQALRRCTTYVTRQNISSRVKS